MVDYPSSLPCPRLSTNVSKPSRVFKSTTFDYGSRKKQTATSQHFVDYSAVLTSAQLTEFRSFYSSLNEGSDEFKAAWMYENNTENRKWRFAKAHSITPLGNDNYEVRTTIESTSRVGKICTLTPSLSLVPGAPLVPCNSAAFLVKDCTLQPSNTFQPGNSVPCQSI